MTITLRPGALRGEIAAMPSKSDLHRLMIAAHLAGMDISGLPVISDDIAATKDCLLAIRNAPGTPLNCRESGSTLRFLLPVMAALGGRITFTGTGRLPERPTQPLVDLLRAHGCPASSDRLPITISGRLQPGTFALPGNISSQYVTGLLFALPLLERDSELVLTSPLESRGYVDMTLRTLRKFGIAIDETEQGFAITGKQEYLPIDNRPLSIEGDWSNAAFWLAAGVRVAGLDEASAQPDKVIAKLLKALPAEIDVSQCPDLVPILSVVMALTPGKRVITNAARLRLKESDRLHAMAVNLHALGADVKQLPDGLEIRGKTMLRGGGAQSFGDHRIAMAMAIAALKCEGAVALRGAQAVRKSYPEFWEDYQRLGGQYEF